jgi:carnitine O-acetyltransferase
VLNLNPFFVLEDGPDPKIAKDPLRRAASLTFCAIKLASSIRDETVLPDTFKGKPLCMDQFKAVFGTARVPNLEGDEIDVYPNSSHVAVISRHQMYYFQALWPDGAVAVEEEDILDILGAVQRNSASVDPNGASRNFLGVLTSLGRRQWALARRNLAAIPMNEEYLCIVDSALFVLVLDDYIPKDINDAAANMLHGSYELKKDKQDSNAYQVGSCLNRWYDKLQIIVCGDGTAGINFEHSTIDGHTALRVVSDIYAETVVSFARNRLPKRSMRME